MCHRCNRSRPAILGGRQDDPDGELQGGWELVPEGWMCPLCLIMSPKHRSRLPTEAQPEEADSIYRLSLDAIAERLGVIRDCVHQMRSGLPIL
jgi:rubredoxin